MLRSVQSDSKQQEILPAVPRGVTFGMPWQSSSCFLQWSVFILQEMSGLPEVEMESLGESASLPRNSPMEPFQQASRCVIIWLFSLMM